jgi:serine kinase of HPr protein (carbohydrate metabolism regulator)
METLNTKIDGKRVLIVGMSGSGKSTVALDIIR